MIYGTGYPVIISEKLATSLSLGNFKYTREDPKPKDKYIVNESVLTSVKNVHLIGGHFTFKITIFKVTRALTLSLMTLKGTLVLYQPHSDNDQRKIPCYLKTVTPFYLDSVVSHDAINIELETTHPWSENSGTVMSETGDGTTPIFTDTDYYWVDENGDNIIDESGNKIILGGN